MSNNRKTNSKRIPYEKFTHHTKCVLDKLELRFTVSRFNEHQMIELFGHFLWQTSLHFSVRMHLNCLTILHVYFSTEGLWESLSSSRKIHDEEEKHTHTHDILWIVTKGICRLCHFTRKFFLREFTSQAVAFWNVATTSTLGYRTSYVQNFLVLCLTVNWTHQDSLHHTRHWYAVTQKCDIFLSVRPLESRIKLHSIFIRAKEFGK